MYRCGSEKWKIIVKTTFFYMFVNLKCAFEKMNDIKAMLIRWQVYFIVSFPCDGRSRRGVLDTTLCYKVCQWLATGRWLSLGTPVSSTNKTDRHDITEIQCSVESGVKHHKSLTPPCDGMSYKLPPKKRTSLIWTGSHQQLSISGYFYLFIYLLQVVECVTMLCLYHSL